MEEAGVENEKCAYGEGGCPGTELGFCRGPFPREPSVA